MDPRPIFFYAFLGILLVTTFLQFYRRSLMGKFAPRIFLYSTFLVAGYLILMAYLQFAAFLGGPLQLILGTKEGFRWFLGYIQLHYVNEYFISFIVAILFVFIARYFNRKFNERFFEREELYLLALGILLTGYPGFIFYIPLVLFASAITSAIFVPRGSRLPLYYFWAPTGVVVLLTIHFLVGSQSWWSSFRF